MLDRARPWRVVVLTDGPPPRSLRIQGRDAKDAPWSLLAAADGHQARLPATQGPPVDSLRIELDFGTPAPAAFVRVAIVPEAAAAAAGR